MIYGICLDENFIHINVEGQKEVLTIPFSIGRNLVTKTWFIGNNEMTEEINNPDIVIDKLYYIMENGGTARIGEEEYNARDLVRYFFSTLFVKLGDVEFVTVVVRDANIKILSKIIKVLSLVLDDDSKYKVTTYSEAFAAYVKSKEASYYEHNIGLFDFTEKAMTYYELERYISEDGKSLWKVKKEEYWSLPLDLLSGDTGKRVCDNLLFQFSKKCIKKIDYSRIILSGVGFVDVSSYREFMNFVCSVSNVDTEVEFFALAASVLSKNIVNKNVDKDITLITDARTTAYIQLYATINQKETKIDLIEPGEEWLAIYNYNFDVILDNSHEIKFKVIKVLENDERDVVVAIPDNFPARYNKTSIVELSITFSQQELFEINATEKGFGEFFEATNECTTLPVEI